MAFEKRIDGHTVFEGVIVNVRKDRAELVNGDIVGREVVEHPGGVTVIPVEDDGTVCASGSSAIPSGGRCWRLRPANWSGGRTRGVRRARALGGDGPDGGRDDIPGSLLHLAGILHRGAAHISGARTAPRGDASRPRRVPERGEVQPGRLTRMVMGGEIDDAKTIIAVLKAGKYLEGRR